MGRRLEVVRRPVIPELTHSERRSWRLHRQLSTHLTSERLEEWIAKLERNLERERTMVRGDRHLKNVDRWQSLIEERDVLGLRRVMTGLDRDSIEMREVSPMGGLLPDSERLDILRDLRRAA